MKFKKALYIDRVPSFDGTTFVDCSFKVVQFGVVRSILVFSTFGSIWSLWIERRKKRVILLCVRNVLTRFEELL